MSRTIRRKNYPKRNLWWGEHTRSSVSAQETYDEALQSELEFQRVIRTDKFKDWTCTRLIKSFVHDHGARSATRREVERIVKSGEYDLYVPDHELRIQMYAKCATW